MVKQSASIEVLHAHREPPAIVQQVHSGDWDGALSCIKKALTRAGTTIDIDQYAEKFKDREPTLQSCAMVVQHSGLLARHVNLSWRQLIAVSEITILQLTDSKYYLVEEKNEEEIHLFCVSENVHVILPQVEFQERWNDQALLLQSLGTSDGEKPKKGFSLFWEAASHYKLPFFEVLLLLAFINLFGLFTPIAFGLVIDKVLMHRGYETLNAITIGLVIIAISEFIFGLVKADILLSIKHRMDAELNFDVLARVLHLPLSFFGKRKSTDVIGRFRKISAIRLFVTDVLEAGLINPVFILLCLVIMGIYSRLLLSIVLLSTVAYVAFLVITRPILQRRLAAAAVRGDRVNSLLNEMVMGIETVKGLSAESYMQRRWESRYLSRLQALSDAYKLQDIIRGGAQIRTRLTWVVVLWIGAHQMIDGILTVGELVTFNMLLRQVDNLVGRIVPLWSRFAEANNQVERLDEILGAELESPNDNYGGLPDITGKIEFQEVEFLYQGNAKKGLRKISFTIPAGQIVGVVGPSGAGKSTLLRLLQRLYEPSSGHILLDGRNIADIDTQWLRRHIAAVPQEATLFNMSIRDNIAIGNPSASFDEIVAAAKLAGAHEFILQKPKGYNTMLDHFGRGLSIGERQRVAIARALVSDPKILILDEFTSALDFESERRISMQMDQICKGRTTFIIAHRPTILKSAERIITISDGQISEDGTPEDVIENNGFFAGLMGEIVELAHAIEA
jgi:subfamily B ATP-binding cassette protein HlyB/CyaB